MNKKTIAKEVFNHRFIKTIIENKIADIKLVNQIIVEEILKENDEQQELRREMIILRGKLKATDPGPDGKEQRANIMTYMQNNFQQQINLVGMGNLYPIARTTGLPVSILKKLQGGKNIIQQINAAHAKSQSRKSHNDAADRYEAGVSSKVQTIRGHLEGFIKDYLKLGAEKFALELKKAPKKIEKLKIALSDAADIDGKNNLPWSKFPWFVTGTLDYDKYDQARKELVNLLAGKKQEPTQEPEKTADKPEPEKPSSEKKPVPEPTKTPEIEAQTLENIQKAAATFRKSFLNPPKKTRYEQGVILKMFIDALKSVLEKTPEPSGEQEAPSIVREVDDQVLDDLKDSASAIREDFEALYRAVLDYEKYIKKAGAEKRYRVLYDVVERLIGELEDGAAAAEAALASSGKQRAQKKTSAINLPPEPMTEVEQEKESISSKIEKIENVHQEIISKYYATIASAKTTSVLRKIAKEVISLLSSVEYIFPSIKPLKTSHGFPDILDFLEKTSLSGIRACERIIRMPRFKKQAVKTFLKYTKELKKQIEKLFIGQEPEDIEAYNDDFELPEPLSEPEETEKEDPEQTFGQMRGTDDPESGTAKPSLITAPTEMADILFKKDRLKKSNEMVQFIVGNYHGLEIEWQALNKVRQFDKFIITGANFIPPSTLKLTLRDDTEGVDDWMPLGGLTQEFDLKSKDEINHIFKNLIIDQKPLKDYLKLGGGIRGRWQKFKGPQTIDEIMKAIVPIVREIINSKRASMRELNG